MQDYPDEERREIKESTIDVVSGVKVDEYAEMLIDLEGTIPKLMKYNSTVYDPFCIISKGECHECPLEKTTDYKCTSHPTHSQMHNLITHLIAVRDGEITWDVYSTEDIERIVRARRDAVVEAIELCGIKV